LAGGARTELMVYSMQEATYSFEALWKLQWL